MYLDSEMEVVIQSVELYHTVNWNGIEDNKPKENQIANLR